MKILDRYLVKGFLVPFGVCVLIFCVLVIMGRFFDRMGIFVAYHAQLRDILAFILLGVPFWLNLVLPIATMLALLFSLGSLNQRGEFTAFRSAGVATWRLLLPYFGVGLVLTAFSMAAGLTFLPQINFQSVKVYRMHIKKRDALEYQKDDVVAAGRQNRRFTIGWLDVEHNEMKDVVVDQIADDLSWVETTSAKLARYQNGRWLFKDGVYRTPDPQSPTGIHEVPFTERWMDIPEKPADFAVEDKDMDDMTGKELLKRAKRLRYRGAPTHKEWVAWHMRLALPFANVVVIALAIPFALRSGAQGRTQNFSYALGLAFFYWGLTSVCQSVGEQGRIPEWLSAWTSNILFSTFAAWRLFLIT